MSTRLTFASGDDWLLYEEYADETAHLVLYDSAEAEITMSDGHADVNLVLSPEVLDKIAELHRKKQFPHQRSPLDAFMALPPDKAEY